MKTTYSWRAKKYLPPNRLLLKRIVESAANMAGLTLEPEQNAALLFVEDREMEIINRQTLGHEGTTDVITFAYLEDELMPDDTALELIVCADVAWREGKRRKNSDYARELVLYLVHGLLHCAGENDLEPQERRRMRRQERRIIGRLSRQFDFNAVFPGKKQLPGTGGNHNEPQN